MTIEETGFKADRLTRDQRTRLLARFAFELTLVGRGTYVAQSEEIAAPQQLRAVNEIQHRIASALVQILGNGKEENWLWQVVTDHADSAGISVEVADAASRALRSVTNTEP